MAEATILDLEREFGRTRDRVHDVENTLRAVDLFAERQKSQGESIAGLRRDLNERHAENQKAVSGLRDELGGLRKTLVAFAFTIAASAVVTAVTVLVSTGKL